jgi:hypothetical protein
MELRDLWLELRTSVWASENAVSHRWGASVTGWEYVVSTTGSSTGTAAADGPAMLSMDGWCILASSACCHGLLDAALWLPSLADEFLRGACLAARGGVASNELDGPDGPSWGVAVRGLLCDLDGGRGALLGFGKRENPPAEGAAMMPSRERCSPWALDEAALFTPFSSAPSSCTPMAKTGQLQSSGEPATDAWWFGQSGRGGLAALLVFGRVETQHRQQ